MLDGDGDGDGARRDRAGLTVYGRDAMTDPLNPANPGNPNNPVRGRRQTEARPRDERTLVRVRDTLGRLEAWARSEGWSEEALSLLALGIAEASADGEVPGLRARLRADRDARRAADAQAAAKEKLDAVLTALKDRPRVALARERSLLDDDDRWHAPPPETAEEQAARVAAEAQRAARQAAYGKLVGRWRDVERSIRLLIEEFQAGGDARTHINSLSRMIQNVPHFPPTPALTELVTACRELHEQQRVARRAEHGEAWEQEIAATETLIEPLRAAILAFNGRRPVDEEMARYLAECCETGSARGPTTFRDLFKSYEAWAMHAGAAPKTEKWFGQQLNIARIDEDPSHATAKRRRGIALKVRQ